MTTTTASPTSTTERDALLADLEDLWRCLDEIFAGLTPADWQRKHGPDWTMADVPYHLSYFDREVVAEPFERGPDIPESERRVIASLAEVNAWNAEQFARRPAGQTPAGSLAQMRASRDRIRRLLAGITDADLDRPAWRVLLGVFFVPARVGLEACRAHTWSHLTELRLRLKRSGPLPSASSVHGALAFYAGIMAEMADRETVAARMRPFTAVLAFSGPGGGAWTLRVAGGACTIAEGVAARPGLTMTQSPDTFLKTVARMQNPLLAMLTRKVKVRGYRNLGAFA